MGGALIGYNSCRLVNWRSCFVWHCDFSFIMAVEVICLGWCCKIIIGLWQVDNACSCTFLTSVGQFCGRWAVRTRNIFKFQCTWKQFWWNTYLFYCETMRLYSLCSRWIQTTEGHQRLITAYSSIECSRILIIKRRWEYFIASFGWLCCWRLFLNLHSSWIVMKQQMQDWLICCSRLCWCWFMMINNFWFVFTNLLGGWILITEPSQGWLRACYRMCSCEIVITGCREWRLLIPCSRVCSWETLITGCRQWMLFFAWSRVCSWEILITGCR